ncbi:hypothetical protein ASPWEDRAFT_117503 [Aspergillus wentii DTO 134E9]|uniref:Cytochrome P450 oxidoreductase n=1 Tax=Aspergillus wentii DTO 134E9 TaxID=1073089 RepID=A0A1L9R787_ASPWE|nr:uncharacterized protein ASPWEDRAFT_118437 [Aspergillus wentii DTO 134E9]XP_040685382.1 uncharacterized protein ASPWEDRAFT_117503 [Aspergillus wentii DTO 134E9]OJJ30776.1 hypothetical protein ASPWEDRAFT_118437 [Aspergillus wentii DTO 134E9]OJJ31705.1 hypothetical protein ASPWEDRAFT_117503 [Aspergillus wentii DTO 134E9]
MGSFQTYAGYLFLAIIIIRLVSNKFRLSGIPGPWLAAYTRLWKVYDVWKGDAHQNAIQLHRKYGKMVRIGPRHVSFSDPKALPIIYGLGKGFNKTAFFPLQSIVWEQKPQMNLFSTRDEQYHREQKRAVANAYRMNSLLEMESSVDSCTDVFISQMGKFADAKKPVDLGIWLQYYAFDVVGELTFSKKLGFLGEGRDVDDMIQAIQGLLLYASVCGQIPEAHPFLLGNPLLPLLIPSMENWNQVLRFTLKAMSSRMSVHNDGKIEQDSDSTGKDMLSRWMAVHQADPERLSSRDMIVHLSGNVFAGSDTTAIALRAIIYLLITHPDKLSKVQAEIDTAAQQGHLSNPLSYRESLTHLPYFAAVMKEAMRLHPSVGLILERHVPSTGATICHQYLPPGTVVGINAWVLHHNEDIYPDPESFIPERWLDSSADKLREMEQSFFAFGGGSRTCIGKNISLMEMHKVLPQLLRTFEIRLHEGRPWKTRNVWFVQQEGFYCELVRR